MRRSSFHDASLADGALALNRVFEQYLLPMNFSAEQLRLHIDYNDVDAAASPLWYDDEGNVIAAALLGVRGERGWIGGFGVAPNYREQGYARQMLQTLEETARARGLRSIQLEVLHGNAGAIHAYRSANFEVARILRSYERIFEEAIEPEGFALADPDDFIERPDTAAPSWQRERASLRNGAASTALTNGTEYGLFRYNTDMAQVSKVNARDAASLDAVASAIAAHCGVHRVLIMNEPGDSTIAGYAQTARWSEPFTQYEMKLELD